MAIVLKRQIHKYFYSFYYWSLQVSADTIKELISNLKRKLFVIDFSREKENEIEAKKINEIRTLSISN